MLAPIVLLATAGCSSTPSALRVDEDAPEVGVVETINTLVLSSSGGPDALATQLQLELGIEPKILGEFRVLGRAPEDSPVQDALVQLSLAWKDFPGLAPTSYGGRRSWPIPFGDDGVTSLGSPLKRTFELKLDDPAATVLARRVEASARFHPVDIVGELIRSAGARIDFPGATLETLARPPGGTLAQWFQEEAGKREPAELFLRAAATPPEGRDEVIKQLVGSLASLKGEEREAGFGALHFLTGITNGRSVYAWETWLLLRGSSGDSKR